MLHYPRPSFKFSLFDSFSNFQVGLHHSFCSNKTISYFDLLWENFRLKINLVQRCVSKLKNLNDFYVLMYIFFWHVSHQTNQFDKTLLYILGKVWKKLQKLHSEYSLTNDSELHNFLGLIIISTFKLSQTSMLMILELVLFIWNSNSTMTKEKWSNIDIRYHII